MTQIGRILIVLLILVSSTGVARAEETDEKPKTIEFPSPDGRFAFRYSDDKSEDEVQTYDLIGKASRKVVTKVAESDPDAGPSMRFTMEKVLWRPDSKAFAVTAFLWKRGTSLFVFARDGSTFREIELPDLSIEIPEKEMKGKDFPTSSSWIRRKRNTGKKTAPSSSRSKPFRTAAATAPRSPPTAPSSSASTNPPKRRTSNRP